MRNHRRFKISVFIFLGVAVTCILVLLGQVQVQQKKDQQKPLSLDQDLQISFQPESPTNHDRIHFYVDSPNPGSVGKIVFFQDDREVGEDASYPWTFEGGPYTVMNHTFGAVAYSLSGKKIIKKYLPVNVTFPDVKLSITQCPASPTARDKIRFIVNARDSRDIHKIVFYIGDREVGEDLVYPWTYDGGPYPDGKFTFGARAIHVSGKEICSRYTSVLVK